MLGVSPVAATAPERLAQLAALAGLREAAP